MRRCVPEHEQREILRKFHGSAYGGHHAGDRTAQKVLPSGFYWPTLFKDARKFILSCDECQRVGNISRRNEMPMNYSLVIEPHLIVGDFTLWVLSLPQKVTLIYVLLLIMLLSG